MLIEGVSKDKDIVEVYQTVRPLETGQDEIHQSLEGGWNITNPECHDSELTQCKCLLLSL